MIDIMLSTLIFNPTNSASFYNDVYILLMTGTDLPTKLYHLYFISHSFTGWLSSDDDHDIFWLLLGISPFVSCDPELLDLTLRLKPRDCGFPVKT